MLTARGLAQEKKKNNPRDCAFLVIPGLISQGTCPGLGKRGNTSVGQEENKGRWLVPVLYLLSSDSRDREKLLHDTELSCLTAEERDRAGLLPGRKQHPREGMHTQRVPGAAHAASFTLQLPEGAAGWSSARTNTGPGQSQVTQEQ